MTTPSDIPSRIPEPLGGQPAYVPPIGGGSSIVRPHTFQYVTYHPISRKPLGPPLRLIGPVWSQVLDGNGSFSAKLTVPDDSDEVATLRIQTEPFRSAIYVKDEVGNFPWGGIITQRIWNKSDASITINAIEWRSWLYDKIIGPYPVTSSTPADFYYQFHQEDQLQIARELVEIATRGGSADGCPLILRGTETSGATPPISAIRDLNFYGSAFRKTADLIDSMAHREGGFEWSIEIYPGLADHWPQLHIVFYYPERGGTIPGLLFNRTTKGANILDYDPITEDGTPVRQRIWAIGSGTTGSSLFVQDTNPDIASGEYLMVEDTWTNSSITQTSTLASNARQERNFKSQTFNQITVKVALSNPDKRLYGIGDRAYLIIADRWMDLHFPTVRISEIQVAPQDGAGTVTVTFNTNDLTEPTVDDGGGV